MFESWRQLDGQEVGCVPTAGVTQSQSGPETGMSCDHRGRHYRVTNHHEDCECEATSVDGGITAIMSAGEMSVHGGIAAITRGEVRYGDDGGTAADRTRVWQIEGLSELAKLAHEDGDFDEWECFMNRIHELKMKEPEKDNSDDEQRHDTPGDGEEKDAGYLQDVGRAYESNAGSVKPVEVLDMVTEVPRERVVHDNSTVTPGLACNKKRKEKRKTEHVVMGWFEEADEPTIEMCFERIERMGRRMSGYDGRQSSEEDCSQGGVMLNGTANEHQI